MMIKSIRKNIRSILSATIGIIAAVITMCYLLLNINTYYMLSFFIVPVLFRFTIILLETKNIYRPELIPSLVLTTELILTIQCILAISFNNINSFFVMLDKLIFPFFYTKPVEQAGVYLAIAAFVFIYIKQKISGFILAIVTYFMLLLAYNLF